MKKITFLVLALMAGMLMNAQFTSMSLVGDGVGGWPTGAAGEVDAHQMTSTDNIHWSINNLTTFNGSLKFRAENSWANNWGGATFPTGTGLFDSQTNNIPTVVGIYNVTFNSTTLEYVFTSASTFPVISLIGPGVGGWEVANDVDLGTTDGVHYSGYGITISGGVKFRKNHDWGAGNWAPPTFPSGTAVFDDPGALEVANDIYNVTFNLETLEYAFNYRSVAIVGSATPGGWPPVPQPQDYMDPDVMTTTDGVNYVINSITLITGAAKFRQDSSWNVQWGGDGNFPAGSGSQAGTDIPVTAGTYSVTLNRTTGAYSFAPPIVAGTATNAKDAFKVYPNPSSATWNIASANGTISSIQVIDMTGKVVMNIAPKGNIALVDATQLSAGIYMAKITAANAVQTVRLIKN